MGIALPWTKHLLAYSTCLSYASYKEEHDHHAKFDSEIEVLHVLHQTIWCNWKLSTNIESIIKGNIKHTEWDN